VLYGSPSADTFSQDLCFILLDARPIHFNLNSTDDSGGMMEDPIETKANRKTKMNFHLMQLLSGACKSTLPRS